MSITLSSRLRLLRITLAAALLLLMGCGRFTGKDAGNQRYGREDSTLTTAPDSTATPGTTPAQDAAPEAARRTSTTRSLCLGPNRPGPSNVESRVDPSGLRLTLTVADKLCFAADEDITMQLDVANVASTTRYIDSNQIDRFLMEPVLGTGSGTSWRDRDCAGTATGATDVAVSLEPGTSHRIFQLQYPGPAGRSERCRHSHGQFDVHALLRVCPAETVHDGACDPDRTLIVSSAPIRIVIA
jgi:hypothetical protein